MSSNLNQIAQANLVVKFFDVYRQSWGDQAAVGLVKRLAGDVFNLHGEHSKLITYYVNDND